ncbi:hypothetical protein QUG02_22970 [Bacillus hominis]|uniref:DUF3953 domain-containing protein n=1 Tax=Bacillus hominis TaxID=2817478 RepID=A0ABT7RDC3_9BACI|nr:hypothetical protein [Bacillus hominis]MDM5195826.1 hypothetical protein [Bacillus hominis]MDM5435486.1 hypothetical protein [Bacillus hominis]MDM5440935.1 hypothetical protein [Bacillus hominis]
MLRILRIIIVLTVIIMSATQLYTGQNNFLSLSQFLLGALMFLIAMEQIKKKEGLDVKRITNYFFTYRFIYSNL